MNIELSMKNISGFEIKDACYVIRRLCEKNKQDVLINFCDGEYMLKTDYAYEQFCFISNNDYGLKQIAVPIIGMKNIVIDGKGAKLNCIGRILPFFICNSENITIKNFSIDYERPFFSQGEVLESLPNHLVIRIDKQQYPYRIKDTVVTFYGRDYESDYVHGLLEYSLDEDRPDKDAVDMGICGALIAEELEEGVLCIKNTFRHLPKVGTMLSIKHEKRFVPAIFINNSKDIVLENIIIRHAGTMGVIAQHTENVNITGMQISPEKNSKRVVSVNADALHFVGCRGIVRIENSLFEKQLDDILNVHGNYFGIHKVIDNKTVVAEIPHRQQVGVFGIVKGDRLYICSEKTMKQEQQVYVKEVKILNKKYCILTFDIAYDFRNERKYCLEKADDYPDVIFRNNIGGKNRARGLLLTSCGKTVIENNHLDCEGAVIKISGDMNNWYESGSTSDICIRNNDMRRHNKNVWGKAIIDIDPEMEKLEKSFYFHKNILVEKNAIELDEFPIFYGQSVENLILSENRFISNSCKEDPNLKINMKHVKNFEIRDNKYESSGIDHDSTIQND